MKREYSYYLDLAINLDLDRKFTRVGIIPYFIENGERNYIVCIWKGHLGPTNIVAEELGDFGGGLLSGEDAIQAACRELDEESLGLLKLTYSDVLNKSTYLCRNNHAIFFVPVELSIDMKDCDRYFQILKERQVIAKTSVIRTKSKDEVSESNGPLSIPSYNHEEIHGIKCIKHSQMLDILSGSSTEKFYYKTARLIENYFFTNTKTATMLY